MILVFCVTGCSTSRQTNQNYSKRVMEYGQPVPKGGGRYKVGKPYQIGDEWFYPKEEPDYDKTGIASWYGDDFHGRYTANGEIYDMDALTAAHPTLPIPSYVKVTNLENNRTLLVRVNDRGPYAHNRVIDMSRYGATLLGFKNQGTARVRVTYIGKAPLSGDDTYEKRFLASQPWYNGQPLHHGQGRAYEMSDANQMHDSDFVGSLPDQRYQRDESAWPSERSGYSIQAGIYRQYQNALNRKAQLSHLKSQSIPAMIRRGSRENMTMYRVLVGRYTSVAQAEQDFHHLRSLGIRDIIIVRNDRNF